MADNYAYWSKNPKTTFDVIEELDKREKAVLLLLDTPKGAKKVWCPKKDVDVFSREINGRRILEALIPEWLVQKAELLEPLNREP